MGRLPTRACRVARDQCANPFVRQDLKQYRMGDSTIDNVGAANAIFDCVEGAFYLRQHSAADGAILDAFLNSLGG